MKKRIFAACTFSLLLALAFIPASSPGQDNKQPETSLTPKNQISKARLLAYTHVNAGYGPYFVFDLKVKVLGFTFVMIPKHGDAYIENVTGNALTSTIRQQILKVRPGDMIILSQVKTQSEAGIMVIDGPVLTVI